LSSASAFGRGPRPIGVDLGRVGDDRVERLLELFPERLGLLPRQALAVQHDGELEILSSVTSRNSSLNCFAVPHPGRVIRSDQLAAAFDVLAGNEVREAEDAPADAVARLDDGHVVAGPRQLVGGGEAAEAGADDDDAPGLRLGRSPRSAR
jgi:hypothetical protein